MPSLNVLFGRQWWWTTLLALAAIAVMVRLGIWQLDRLEARRTFNARVSAQLAGPPLELAGEALGADLFAMEYRTAVVTGEYDHAQQAALRNQVWQNQPGVHLLTPLVIEGTQQAILVDRGWIPLEDAAPERWGQYDEPGRVVVRGWLRRPQARPDFGGVPDPPGRLTAWNLVNLERLQEQISYDLLPVYLQPEAEPERAAPPQRSRSELELTEGPHFGYAMQWFLFALVLAAGYPRYVLHHIRPRGA